MEGGRQEEVMVADKGRELIMGENTARGRTSAPWPSIPPPATLPNIGGISRDSRKMAARLSDSLAGPSRAVNKVAGSDDSMLVRGGGIEMCDAWSCFL